MATATTTKTETPAAPIEIDPARVVVNVDGLVWKSVLATMPEGMTKDQLQDARIWARVQKTPGALKVFDQVVITDYERSYGCEGRVTAANRDGATIAFGRIFNFADRLMPLYQDALYRIVYLGGWYHAERLSDGMKMTQPVQTHEEAVAALHRLYPHQVA
jgi:hypothetical protein